MFISTATKVEAIALLSHSDVLTGREQEFLLSIAGPLYHQWTEPQRKWFEAIRARVNKLQRAKP